MTRPSPFSKEVHDDVPGQQAEQRRHHDDAQVKGARHRQRRRRTLVTAGCAKPVRDFKTRVIVSRTLAAAGTAESRVRLIKLTGAACPG